MRTPGFAAEASFYSSGGNYATVFRRGLTPRTEFEVHLSARLPSMRQIRVLRCRPVLPARNHWRSERTLSRVSRSKSISRWSRIGARAHGTRDSKMMTG